MHPKLTSFPDIGSYSALFLTGFFFAYLLSRWHGRRLGIEGRHIDNLTLCILIFSLFGARFFSWLFYSPPGITLWQALTMGGRGGLVFYGGLIFALLTLFVYSRIFQVRALSLADVLAPGVAVGLAFGRVGCFLGGCCWGDVCAAPAVLAQLNDSNVRRQVQTLPALSPPGYPLAVRFPRESDISRQHRKLGLITADAPRSLPVHPVQLYEAVLAAALAVILSLALYRQHRPGDVLWALGIGYGCIRFFTEFFRADNRPAYWGMTVSQVISLAIAAGFLLVFLLRRRSSALPSQDGRGLPLP